MAALETLLQPTINALSVGGIAKPGVPTDYTISAITYDDNNGSPRVSVRAVASHTAIAISYYIDGLVENHKPTRDLYAENDPWTNGKVPWVHIVRLPSSVLSTALHEIEGGLAGGCSGIMDHLGSNIMDHSGNCITA